MNEYGEREVYPSRRAVAKMMLASAWALAAFGAGCARDAAPNEELEDVPSATSVVVSDTPAEVDVPKSEFARMVQAGEVSSIRLIGDSITAGYGCDGFGPTTDVVAYEGSYGAFYESVAEVACWANDFRVWSAEAGVSGFVNAGVCGAKMWWLAEDPAAWIREAADVIFVMLGTNDAVYSTEDEYRSNALTALSAVAASCHHMVVLAPPNNAWTDYDKAMEQDAVERILRELCAEQGWDFISLLDAIVPGTDLVNDDQCHPTTKGSHAMWEKLREELGI